MPFKPLAWEGIGIRIPHDWDFTGHRGFWRQGVVKARSVEGSRVELAWRPANTRDDLAKLAARLQPGVEWRPWAVSAAGTNVVSSQGFTVGHTDERGRRLFLAQTHHRLVMLTLDRIDVALAARIVQSLEMTDTPDEPQPWGLLEFSVTSPAGYELIESSIQAGVCLLRWRKGRRHLLLRRFSSGHAGMGLPLNADLNDPKALERFNAWIDLVYARESADAKYTRQTITDNAQRLHVTLRSRPRRFAAMEITALIPNHRRQYRWIQIVWDKPACKVYCVESTHDDDTADAAVQELIRTMAFHPCPPTQSLKLPIKQVVKRKIKTHKGERGQLLVEIEHPRPRALGFLPLLLGQKPNHAPVIHRAELDPIGTWLWERLGRSSLEQIIQQLQQTLQLSARETRMATMTYLHILAKWRMVDIEVNQTSEPEDQDATELLSSR